MNKLIRIDKQYSNWIKKISSRFRASQIKAAVRVNDEMLRFYWNLGCDLNTLKKKYDWGSHFYDQISKDIQKQLPDVKSFSTRNLLYMHQFYRLYPTALTAPQVDAQLPEDSITPQVGAQLDKSIWITVFNIPWGQ